MFIRTILPILAFWVSLSYAWSNPIQAVQGESRSLNSNFMGYAAIFTRGPSTLINHPWNDTQMLSALGTSGAGNLRFPAGTEVNWWNWQSGWVDPATEKQAAMPPFIQQMLMSGNVGIYQLADLATAVQRTGVTPIFLLNMMTDSLSSAETELKTAEMLNLPVRYIELGNEFYLTYPGYLQRYPTIADYASEAATWTQQLHQDFPEAQIAIVGYNNTVMPQGASPRQLDWNDQVTEAVPLADALTLHMYLPPLNTISNTPDTFADAMLEQYHSLAATDGPANLIGEALQIQSALSAVDVYQKPLWITEFGLMSNTQQQYANADSDTWASALLVAAILNAFLSDPRVSLSDFCNFEQANQNAFLTSTVFGSNNALNDLPIDASLKQSLSTTPGALTAEGQVLSVFGQAMQGATLAIPIDFATNPSVSSSSGDYPALFGWIFDTPEGQEQGLVVNLSGQPLSINTTAFSDFNHPSFSTLQNAPTFYITGNTAFMQNKGPLGATLNLPAYSITKVSSTT